MDPITVAYSYDFTPTELRTKALVIRSPMSQIFEPMITAYVKELGANFHGSLMSSIRGYLAAERLYGSGRTMQEIADTDLTWAWTAAAMSQRRLVPTIEFLSHAGFVARLADGWGRDAEFFNVVMITLEWSPLRMKFATTSNRFAKTNAKIIRLINEIAGTPYVKVNRVKITKLDDDETDPSILPDIDAKIAENDAKLDELIDIKLGLMKTCAPDEITRSAMRRYWRRYANQFLTNSNVVVPEIELVWQDEMMTLITKTYESLPETPEFLKNFGLDAGMMQRGIALVQELAANPRSVGQQFLNMFASQIEQVSITHGNSAVQGLLETGKKFLIDLTKNNPVLSPETTEAVKTFDEKLTALFDRIDTPLVTNVTGGANIGPEDVLGEVSNFIESCAKGDFMKTTVGKIFADVAGRANMDRPRTDIPLPSPGEVSSAIHDFLTRRHANPPSQASVDNNIDTIVENFQNLITNWKTKPSPPPRAAAATAATTDANLADASRIIEKIVNQFNMSHEPEVVSSGDADLNDEIQELLGDMRSLQADTDLSDEIQEVTNAHGSNDDDASSDCSSSSSCDFCPGCEVRRLCCYSDDDSPSTPVAPGTPTPASPVAPDTPEVFPEAGPSRA